MKSFLKDVLESKIDTFPIAVIILGNSKYLQDPKVSTLAKDFYNDIKTILSEKGYNVEFDAGADFTTPNKKAVVWIGHSRGVSRLKFASKGIKTIELQTLDYGKKYLNQDDQGLDPDHYKLSPIDINALNSI